MHCVRASKARLLEERIKPVGFFLAWRSISRIVFANADLLRPDATFPTRNKSKVATRRSVRRVTANRLLDGTSI
jgi:hypothetical protein